MYVTLVANIFEGRSEGQGKDRGDNRGQRKRHFGGKARYFNLFSDSKFRCFCTLWTCHHFTKPVNGWRSNAWFVESLLPSLWLFSMWAILASSPFLILGLFRMGIGGQIFMAWCTHCDSTSNVKALKETRRSTDHQRGNVIVCHRTFNASTTFVSVLHLLYYLVLT